MSPDLPPDLAGSMLKRALIGAIAIIVMTAGAVASAALLQADEVINIVEGEGRKPIPIPEIDRADAGEARTIMILGSDARYATRTDKRDRRSDTIILARLDPDKEVITLMSIPRDLKVTIPSLKGALGGYRDKINAAYSNGGARLTLKTVKELLSTPERPFKINHVVNIDFSGFRRAVDYLDCVYVDIDRRYFNDRGGPGGFATIDIQPGYQKICGRDALDYVRYRHEDNDLVRAARQQDFLRQLKDDDDVKQRLDVLKSDVRREVAKMVGRYVDTDKSLREKQQLFGLFKLAAFTASKPIQEVQFGAGRLADEGGTYLTASESAIKKTVDNFLNGRTSAKPITKLEPTEDERRAARTQRKRKRNKASEVPGLEIARKEGEDQAIVGNNKVDFPFYYPTLRTTGAQYASPEPRTYSIRDGKGELHRAYRLVLKKGQIGEYYGVQAMSWKAPPILDAPHDTESANGRKLEIYYDGRRVRLVAWRTKRAIYYVHNTLLRTLSKRQMVAIAGSLKRLGS